MATTGKKKGSSGHGGHKVTTGRVMDTTTPESSRPTPRLKLRLPPAPNSTKEAQNTTATSHALLPQDEPTNEQAELPVADPTIVTTRRGRQVRRPKTMDDIYGSDFDRLVGQSPIQKADDDDDYQVGTDDVQIFQLKPKRKPSRPAKNVSFKSPLDKVDEEEDDASSSDTIGQSPPTEGLFLTHPDPDVYQIMNALCGTSKIHIDLPALTNSANPDAEQPYSAKFLIQLYLLCYDSQQWNLCDLIADTWIRAFHQVRKRGEKSEKQPQLWRRNPALERKKRELEERARNVRRYGGKAPSGVGFDPNPPDYDLSVLDPELAANVTDFNSALLNQLYQYTQEKCGARLLWADAMALGGDKMEKELGGSMKKGTEWHADLLFNVMQTSLRMVRRKLTLKIEESTEGSWCKRYHEHGKHGLPCYRELAWQRKDGEDSSDEDEHGDGDAMDMEELMEAEMARSMTMEM